MNRIITNILLLGVFCLVASAQSVDELVGKNIAARGGLKKFHALRTLHISAHLTGPGTDLSVKVYFKHPGKYRQEILLRGKSTIEAYDGHRGWRLRGLEDKTIAELLTGDDLGNIQDQIYPDGPLVDYKAKGITIELLGKEKVKDIECYKLNVTYRSGTKMIQYLDVNSFLEIREELTRKVDGKIFEIEEQVGDYRSVGGMLFAHAFDSNTKGSAEHYILTVEKMDLNKPITDALFNLPKVQVTQVKPRIQK